MPSADPSPTPNQTPITRLAPSPTGALHLGNARTFVVNWALARARGWQILLRIEDLDGPRVKPGVIEQTIDTLAWLGLDWDGPIRRQSTDLEPYRDAMAGLAERGLVYPCELTRAQIAEAATAPHEGDRELRYPPSLRPAERPGRFDHPDTNWRFATPDATVAIQDAFAGPQSLSPFESVGDFVVWTKRGEPAYQLAVVVDDHASGVTRVVRGADLLDSAARQLLLIRALGLTPEPTYLHLPLVRGADGRRLAKRHGDTRIETYRAEGVPRDRVLGLLAWWCGMVEAPEPVSPEAFVTNLDLSRIRRWDITFRPEDDQWLRETPKASG